MVTPVAVVGATGRLGALVASVVEELPGFELVARLSSKDGAHEAPPSVFAGAELVVDVTVPRSARRSSRTRSPAERTCSSGPRGGPRRGSRSSGRPRGPTRPGCPRRPELLDRLGARYPPRDDRRAVVPVGRDRRDPPRRQGGLAVRHRRPHRGAHRRRPPRGRPGRRPPRRPARPRQQVASIPIHSLRLPGVKAVQDVLLSGPGETLTIRHDTNDDVAYLSGIRAALSAVGSMRGPHGGARQRARDRLRSGPCVRSCGHRSGAPRSWRCSSCSTSCSSGSVPSRSSPRVSRSASASASRCSSSR